MQTATLESVQAEFQHWRQHRPYLRSPIPSVLRAKALSLRDQYATPAICKALSITERMLIAWEDAATPAEPLSPAPLAFVALPTGEEAGCRDATTLALSCTQPGGIQWCLRGNPSPEQLRVLVSAIKGEAR
jgi:hypothetical protein